MDRRRGSILLLALWSLFLLSFFCTIMGGAMRQKLELVRRLQDRGALEEALDAAVQKAIAAAVPERERADQWLNQVWSNDPSVFRDIDTGGCLVSVTRAVDAGSEGPVILYGLEDEESKINLNKASPQVMERLFKVCGMEDTAAVNLAYSIVDWRDNDEFLSVPVGTAESSYYRGLPAPYEAKNAEFETPEELLLVKGMDENFFKKIRKYITIYGDGTVNVNTAPAPVLAALGLSEDTIELLTGYRNGKDGIPGTGDDAEFLSAGAVASDLSAVRRLSASELTELSQCVSRGLFGVRSRYFTVRAGAAMKRGKSTSSLNAVIDINGSIIYWEET